MIDWLGSPVLHKAAADPVAVAVSKLTASAGFGAITAQPTNNAVNVTSVFGSQALVMVGPPCRLRVRIPLRRDLRRQLGAASSVPQHSFVTPPIAGKPLKPRLRRSPPPRRSRSADRPDPGRHERRRSPALPGRFAGVMWVSTVNAVNVS